VKHEEKFRLRLSNLIIIFGLLILIAMVTTWAVTAVWLDMDPSLALAMSLAFGLIAVLTLATFGQKTLARPTSVIAKAVTHVQQQDKQPTTKPDSSPGRLGGDYIRELVKDIYGLATFGNEVVNKTESRRAYLDYLLKSVPFAVFVFDKAGNLQYSNQTGRSYLDIDYKEAQGMHIDKVLPLQFQSDDNLESWVEFSRENKIKDDKFFERVSLVRIDSSRNIFDAIAHYSKDDPAGVEVLLALAERTEQYMADESEMDFVALAAHELRGPITIIRGYLDVFEDEMKDVFNVEQRGLLQKATVASEQLSDTVNNILNIARIDQEHMKLHIRETNWADVINETYENLKLRAQVHGRVLKLAIPDKLPSIAVDRASIMEVISNLVDNAIKYSYEGGTITISVKEEDNFISTTVQDNGIGIPKSVIGKLFTKFYRSHRSRQAVTGTGLGLYICKVIVDSHGGNIWVRSTEGKGSTFGFELPTYESVAEALEKGDSDGLEIKRSSHGWIKNHSMYRR